jgi:hypothetical protein
VRATEKGFTIQSTGLQALQDPDAGSKVLSAIFQIIGAANPFSVRIWFVL